MKTKWITVEVWEFDPRDPENQSPYSEMAFVGHFSVPVRETRNPEGMKRAALNKFRRDNPQFRKPHHELRAK